MTAASSDIGLIGLAVMGQNLALNIADHSFNISVFNALTQRPKPLFRQTQVRWCWRVLNTRRLCRIIDTPAKNYYLVQQKVTGCAGRCLAAPLGCGRHYHRWRQRQMGWHYSSETALTEMASALSVQAFQAEKKVLDLPFIDARGSLKLEGVGADLTAIAAKWIRRAASYRGGLQVNR